MGRYRVFVYWFGVLVVKKEKKLEYFYHKCTSLGFFVSLTLFCVGCGWYSLDIQCNYQLVGSYPTYNDIKQNDDQEERIWKFGSSQCIEFSHLPFPCCLALSFSLKPISWECVTWLYMQAHISVVVLNLLKVTLIGWLSLSETQNMVD